MEKSFVTVVGISDMRQDKNGNDFRTITVQNPVFQTVVDEASGDVRTELTPALKGTRSAYEESYLDGTKDWLANAQVGHIIGGRVEKRAVEQYDFIGKDGSARIASSYTCPVFGDTTQESWESVVKTAFRNSGHPLPGDTTAKKSEATAEAPAEAPRVDITAGVTAPSSKKAVVQEF